MPGFADPGITVEDSQPSKAKGTGILVSILETIKEKLADREWVNIYQATGKCTLSINARLIHGYLRRRAKADTPPDNQTIAEAVGINRDRSVPRALTELVDAGLAIKEGKGHRAIDACDRHLDWFPPRKSLRGPKYIRVYLTSEDCTLTTATNLTFWLMVNLASQPLSDGGNRLTRNTKAGLAKMCGVGISTLKRSLSELEDRGLFKETDEGLTVAVPNDPNLWKSRTTTPDGKDLWPASETGKRIRDEWEHVQFDDDEQKNILLDLVQKSWKAMRASHYYQSDALRIVRLVRDNTKDVFDACNFLTNFDEYIRQADDHHKPNGRYRCSLYALEKIAKKRWLPGAASKAPRAKT